MLRHADSNKKCASPFAFLYDLQKRLICGYTAASLRHVSKSPFLLYDLQTGPGRVCPLQCILFLLTDEAAQQWAQHVRQLKEVQGLPNKDPQVVQAVQAMQQWKARLTALQEALKEELEAAKALFGDEEEEEEEGKGQEEDGYDEALISEAENILKQKS